MGRASGVRRVGGPTGWGGPVGWGKGGSTYKVG